MRGLDHFACREMTCAHGCYTSSRVYVGTADGSMRAVDVDVSSDSNGSELPQTQVDWVVRIGPHAVTSVCGVKVGEKGSLLLVGSAGGDLVLLCEDLEVRRFQLESAVQHICYHQSGEFIVGDAVGNLYGVTQYEIRWQKRLAALTSRDDVGAEYFYPTLAQPTVQAITCARLLDVEKTLSNYVIVATGQRYLMLTHCGKTFGTIPTRTPIVALTSIPVDGEDIILASGEEGIIYRLESYRNLGSSNMPDFRFAMNTWAQVSFPVQKLVSIKITDEKNTSEFPWICLGVNGEVALCRGRELVKQWSATSFPSTRDVELAIPVDLTLLHSGDVDKQQRGVIVFTDRIYTFSIEQWLSKSYNSTHLLI